MNNKKSLAINSLAVAWSEGSIALMIYALVSATIIAFLYFPFLTSPLVFDDWSYFGVEEKLDNTAWVNFWGRRMVWRHSYAFFSFFFGDGLESHRAANFFLHWVIGCTIFAIVTVIAKWCVQKKWQGWFSYGLVGASTLLFVAHPATVYATAYLVQRSIILATLFSLLMLLFTWHGIESKRREWVFGGCFFYLMALFSKDSAIFAPLGVLCTVLPLAWQRLRGQIVNWLIGPMLLCSLTAFMAFASLDYSVSETFGHGSANIVRQYSDMELRLMSSKMQFLMALKYLQAWIIPIYDSISIDMPQLLGLVGKLEIALLGMVYIGLMIAFLVGAVSCTRLVPVVLPLLWFMALYLSEFVPTRLQDIFVVYRSYLWMPLLPMLVVGMSSWISAKWILAVILLPCIWLGIQSSRHLVLFSDNLLLWAHAIDVAEGANNGADLTRLYRNRGIEFLRRQQFKQSIDDLSRSISGKQTGFHAEAYDNRGLAYANLGDWQKAFADFDEAIRLKPKLATAYYNRGIYKARQGKEIEALNDLNQSCALKLPEACAILARIKNRYD